MSTFFDVCIVICRKVKMMRLTNFLKFVLAMSVITANIVFNRLLSLCPPLFRLFHRKNEKYSPRGITGMDLEGYTWTYGNLSTWLFVFEKMYLEYAYKKAYKNGRAPNPSVLTVDGKVQVKLLDFASAGRPFVLNFGSCS